MSVTDAQALGCSSNQKSPTAPPTSSHHEVDAAEAAARSLLLEPGRVVHHRVRRRRRLLAEAGQVGREGATPLDRGAALADRTGRQSPGVRVGAARRRERRQSSSRQSRSRASATRQRTFRSAPADSSVPEVPAAGEDHRDRRPGRRPATTSSSRMEPPGWMTAVMPASMAELRAVGEREEGVGGERRAVERGLRLLEREAHGVDAAHLTGADARRSRARGRARWRSSARGGRPARRTASRSTRPRSACAR